MSTQERDLDQGTKTLDRFPPRSFRCNITLRGKLTDENHTFKHVVFSVISITVKSTVRKLKGGQYQM